MEPDGIEPTTSCLRRVGDAGLPSVGYQNPLRLLAHRLARGAAAVLIAMVVASRKLPKTRGRRSRRRVFATAEVRHPVAPSAEAMS